MIELEIVYLENMHNGEHLMKKLLTLLLLGLVLIGLSGCPDQKFPQGRQVPPEDVQK